MAAFNDVALDDAGVNRDSGSINICCRCLDRLQHKQTPRLALANGLEVGRLPPELRDLTWAEQRVISVYNAHVYLLYFNNEHIPGAQTEEQFSRFRQPHFKGNVFCVPQDSISVQKFLPCPPEQLKSMFQVLQILVLCMLISVSLMQVIFLGANKPIPQDVRMTRSLTVSRDKLRNALQWLIKHNSLYKRLFDNRELHISEENLNKYPNAGGIVPDAVVDDAILRATSSDDLAQDTSSYTRPDFAAASPSNKAVT